MARGVKTKWPEWVRDTIEQWEHHDIRPPKDRSFTLSDDLMDCPRFWVEFVKQTNTLSSKAGEKIVDDTLLSEHNGFILDVTKNSKFKSFVVFREHTDAVIFKLRWA